MQEEKRQMSKVALTAVSDSQGVHRLVWTKRKFRAAKTRLASILSQNAVQTTSGPDTRAENQWVMPANHIPQVWLMVVKSRLRTARRDTPNWTPSASATSHLMRKGPQACAAGVECVHGSHCHACAQAHVSARARVPYVCKRARVREPALARGTARGQAGASARVCA